MADGRRRSGEPRHESGQPAAAGRRPAASGSGAAARDATVGTQDPALRTDEALPLPGQLSRLAALHRINRAATASLDLEELRGPERRLSGVLNIQTRERHEFDADELEFLRTVAGELAIAIENAQLYGLAGARLRRKVRELTTLQRVSATLASTLDLKELLNIVAEQACDLGRAQRVEIYRARGATPALLASNGDPDHPFEAAVVGRSLEAAMATPPGDGVD